MTQTRIFEPDGRAVPFVDQGEGPALVLLPGRGLELAYLGILANMLADEGFHVLRVGTRRPAAVTPRQNRYLGHPSSPLDVVSRNSLWHRNIP